MATELYRVFCPAEDVGHLPPGVAVVEAYPAFVIASMDEGAAAAVRQRYPAERLDPPAPPPALPVGLGVLAPAPGGAGGAASLAKDFRVWLQTPLSDKLVKAVEKAGATVRETVGQFGLVVHLPTKAVQKRVTEALPAGAVVDKYVPEVQLSDALLSPATGAGPAPADATPAAGGGPFAVLGTVVATFFSAADRDKAAKSLRTAGVKDAVPAGDDRLVVNVGAGAAATAALREVLRRPGLRRLEEKRINKPSNSVARGILGTGVFDPAPGGLGLTGTGEVVAVCDTGLDTGLGGPADPIHPDFKGRVAFIRSYPITPDLSPFVQNPGGNDGAADRFSGHGTHVAGSVLGNGARATALGLPPVAGSAPAARLVFQAVEQTPKWTPATVQQFAASGQSPPASGLFGIPNDLKALFQEAYDKGARVHTNSWGSSAASTQGKYDAQCDDVDRFMWEHKDILILFAAGNDGVADGSRKFVRPGSVSPPGTAKNCLTVGASENDRDALFGTQRYGDWWPGDFPKGGPGQPAGLGEDRMADAVNDLAAFSSRGPCATGRRKPDVVAPGTFILSTRSSQIAPNNFAWSSFPAAKKDYFYMGGTSMATPLAAGCAAVVRQYLRTKAGIAKPGGALMKAVLVHSAQYRKNRFAHPKATAPADNEQGWGRIDLRAALAPTAPTKVLFLEEKTGLKTGEQREFLVKITNPAAPLRVTLAYTDFPGANLVNNLNLLVFSPSNAPVVGNDFGGTGVPDALNNVEGVLVAAPAAGTWKVRVVASSVPKPKQDFALVVSGGGASLV